MAKQRRKNRLFDSVNQQIEQVGNELITAGLDWSVLDDARNYKSCVSHLRARKVLDIMGDYELLMFGEKYIIRNTW